MRRPVPEAEALDFRDVDAVSADSAVVLSIGPGEASRIYRTEDGGATWSERFRNLEPEAFFDAVAFADARRGAAVSDSVGGRFVVRLTADGGRTWTPVPADRLPPALAGEGAFAASGTNVAMAGPQHIWIGTTAGRVLRSIDGGRSWTVHRTPIATGQATGIFSIAFRDAGHGVVVGGNYQQEAAAIDNVAVTSDGGASWTLVTDRALSGFRSAVAWVPRSGRSWLAVGPSGADWSADDGRTWTPAGGAGYDALSFAPDGAVGWATGSGGRIAAGRRSPDSAADAAVVVLRAEALEQRDGLGERLHALHRTVGHVDRRLAAAARRPSRPRPSTRGTESARCRRATAA